jgi:hypothetical protein
MSGVVASVISGAAVVLSAWILRKVQQVHVLVNSRLDSTLAEIADLKEQRAVKAREAGKPVPPA